MRPHHPFSTENPILVNTFFNFPSVSPAGGGITGCGAGGSEYGGVQFGCGVGTLSAPRVVSSCCFVHQMVTVSTVSTDMEVTVLEPGYPILRWHTLRHQLRLILSFVGVWTNRSHGMHGVARSHSTNPTGIMSSFGVSTLACWYSRTGVLFTF